MNNKEEYYRALKNNKGRLDEIELGEILGLDEDTTRSIINSLLVEYRIEHKMDKMCGYTIV